MKGVLSTRRYRLVGAGFAAYATIACLRVLYLGNFSDAGLVEKGEQQRLRQIELPAERGTIVDRNFDALARTVESAAIFVRPRQAKLTPSQVEQLAQVVELPTDVVRERLASKQPYVFLRRNASPSLADAIADLGFPGVGSEPTRARVYPWGSVGGQLVGFSGIDGQGLEGIELAYDRYLRGTPEKVLAVRDARGRYIIPSGTDAPASSQGARVELTIDLDLQRVARDALVDAVQRYEAASGTAIVMDVNNGQILAMTSAPTFDPNRSEERRPDRWRNRAAVDQFEPGSTFKTFLAAAAVEEGVVWPEKRYFCENGAYRIGRRTIHDHHPQGWLTFADIIRVSSNIGCAKVAEQLGSERFERSLRGFGFGRPTGIDLPSEVPGLLSPAKAWRPINQATIAFGHGVAVTALQMVNAYAAVANGGKLLRPYVVSRVTAADGTVLVDNQPKVVGRPLSERTAAVIRDMLVAVVESGTGTGAAVPGVRVAGKTGTTRKLDPETGTYSRRDYVGSFVGFLPAEDPRFAILAMIDTPRGQYYGGVVAAPVFGAIGDYLAERADLKRLPEAAPSVDDEVLDGTLVHWGNGGGAMPNYVGKSLREVLSQATQAGWDVEIQGSGFVVSQDPPPGAQAADGVKLKLKLAESVG